MLQECTLRSIAARKKWYHSREPRRHGSISAEHCWHLCMRWWFAWLTEITPPLQAMAADNRLRNCKQDWRSWSSTVFAYSPSSYRHEQEQLSLEKKCLENLSHKFLNVKDVGKKSPRVCERAVLLLAKQLEPPWGPPCQAWIARRSCYYSFSRFFKQARLWVCVAARISIFCRLCSSCFNHRYSSAIALLLVLEIYFFNFQPVAWKGSEVVKIRMENPALRYRAQANVKKIWKGTTSRKYAWIL